MVFFSFIDVFCFLPELFLGFCICFFLVLGSFFSSLKDIYFNKTFILRKPFFWFSLEIILFLFFICINNVSFYNNFFFGTFIFDSLAFFGKLFLVFIYFLVFFSSFKFLKNQKINVFEYYVLLLLSLFGMLVIISSTDLLSFYLALELQSLCFYTLANFKRNSSFSTEAGLKYFIIGAFSTGLFLLGCSFIYGFTGSTNFFFLRDLFGFTESVSFFSVYVGFFFISIGFLFKLGCAPFHFWVCDVYEGAPLVVTVFFSTAPKIALIVSFTRLIFFSFFSFFLFISFFLFFVLFVALLLVLLVVWLKGKSNVFWYLVQ